MVLASPNMLGTGPSMDPVTRTPRSMIQETKRELREALNEETLRSQAKSLNIISSDEGRTLLNLIRTRLERRIDVLIKNDPEADAYRQMIVEMGYTQSLARQAVEKLYKRHLQQQEGT